MKNEARFRRSGSRGDWVISFSLDSERKVNFHFHSEVGSESDGTRVPEDVIDASLRFKHQAAHCWETYVSPLAGLALDPKEDWDSVDVAKSCDGLNDDQKMRLLLSHVLIRKWNGEDGYDDDITLAWVVDPLGRVWEIGDDFVEGWHPLSDIYKGEKWPLGPLTN